MKWHIICSSDYHMSTEVSCYNGKTLNFTLLPQVVTLMLAYCGHRGNVQLYGS